MCGSWEALSSTQAKELALELSPIAKARCGNSSCNLQHKWCLDDRTLERATQPPTRSPPRRRPPEHTHHEPKQPRGKRRTLHERSNLVANRAHLLLHPRTWRPHKLGPIGHSPRAGSGVRSWTMCAAMRHAVATKSATTSTAQAAPQWRSNWLPTSCRMARLCGMIWDARRICSASQEQTRCCFL